MKNALLAWMLAAAAFSASAEEDLGKPHLLVATPELKGLYGRTALLAVPLEGQHIGFILNRATDLTLAHLFPDHVPSAKVVDPVYFGGPEMVGAIFAVVRSNPGGAALPLFDGLFVTASAPAVDRIIEQTPNDARYFAGFVAWRPGELAKEIEAGYWFVADPEAALVFSNDPNGMWEALVKRFGHKRDPRKELQALAAE